MRRHLNPDKSFGPSFDRQKNKTYRSVCLSMALFHAAINERRISPQCGWNQSYVFGEADFDQALLHLCSVSAEKVSPNPTKSTACNLRTFP